MKIRQIQYKLNILNFKIFKTVRLIPAPDPKDYFTGNYKIRSVSLSLLYEL
jgi:hypothetical protein